MLSQDEGEGDGGMEGWKDGGIEGWRDGGMEGWKDGGMEGWKDGDHNSITECLTSLGWLEMRNYSAYRILCLTNTALNAKQPRLPL